MKNTMNIKNLGTCIYHSNPNYEFYKAVYMEEFETEPTENELIEFANECCDEEFNDLVYKIREKEEEGKATYVILATLGRWNGTFEGGKVITGFLSALSACMGDNDDVEIFKSNRGLITINVHHHDGTDTFKIKELTEEGERYLELHEYEMSDRELHKILFNNSHLSRHCRIFKSF